MSRPRDAIRSDDEEADMFAELTSPNLLIIDDPGKKDQAPWAVNMIHMTIDDRCSTQKPVVVTPNYARREQVASLSQDGDRSAAEALVLRLSEMTTKAEMIGEDRRLSKVP